jgi:hypothetical protein
LKGEEEVKATPAEATPAEATKDDKPSTD